MAILHDSGITISAVDPALLERLSQADPQAIAQVSAFMESTRIPPRNIAPIWHASITGLINLQGPRRDRLVKFQDNALRQHTKDCTVFRVYSNLASLVLYGHLSGMSAAEFLRINEQRIADGLKPLVSADPYFAVAVYVCADRARINRGDISLPDPASFLKLSEEVLLHALEKGSDSVKVYVTSSLPTLLGEQHSKILLKKLSSKSNPDAVRMAAYDTLGTLRRRDKLASAQLEFGHISGIFQSKSVQIPPLVDQIYGAVEKVLSSNFDTPDPKLEIAIMQLVSFSVKFDYALSKIHDPEQQALLGGMLYGVEDALFHVLARGPANLKTEAEKGLTAISSKRVDRIAQIIVDTAPRTEDRSQALRIIFARRAASLPPAGQPQRPLARVVQ
ncbi:hypothetical protein HY988_03455 [Candidatus Micrarchaeota archaeon]|nr:hypothetical protein [Candidatus Micrarchaeota archaeon]